MAENPARHSNPKAPELGRVDRSERVPTNEELLRDLWRPKSKPKPGEPGESPAISRRTRDFLLVAGIGSACIALVSFKLLADASPMTVLRLALTGVGAFCGLLWFIFYGVMSRY